MSEDRQRTAISLLLTCQPLLDELLEPLRIKRLVAPTLAIVVTVAGPVTAAV
jgi:hypothetical protein